MGVASKQEDCRTGSARTAKWLAKFRPGGPHKRFLLVWGFRAAATILFALLASKLRTILSPLIRTERE
jgi:hypothetical protein